jgi:adenylate kinase family enzyme
MAPALDLVLQRFRLRARRRAAWLRHLWSEEAEPAGRVAVTHGEADAVLEDRDSPEAEAAWLAVPHETDGLREVESALAEDTTSRFTALCRILGLSAAEADLLQASAAVAMDPSLARVCAYLQDQVGRSYLSEELAARLYGYGRCSIWTGESSLYRWEVLSSREVAPAEPRAVVCDPQIREWLAGGDPLHESFAGLASVVRPRTPPASWPVQDTIAFIRDCAGREGAPPIRLIILGARGSGRRTFAAVVSAGLGLSLLAIDADQVEEANWRRVYLLAQRQAYLGGMALAWYGESAVRRSWPSNVPSFPIHFVIVEPGQEPLSCGAAEHRVRVPGLSVEERFELWRRFVPASSGWAPDELRTLASRYRVQIGDIARVGQSAVGSSADAGLLVRQASRGRLGNLAQLLQCPFRWDDLVVPQVLRDALEDIVFEANHRAVFWEQSEARRLFPQGQGLMALFSGHPGTGKTMAAQVMAATLGYDLFSVDLAGVVSKWVGETSQNFERILTRAADMHAMLLFDECDAIFAKRTSEVRDAQDKFANTDAAYLLQAIEAYPGVALLATNQKGNIDPAFIRRLRYVLEFAKPDAAQRLEIWRKVVGGLAGDRVQALDAPLSMFAESVTSTGSQIKYAVLGAMFAARREDAPLAVRHLLRGLERELGKEGRSLSARERERMLSYGG